MSENDNNPGPALTWLHNQVSTHLVCLGAVYLLLDQDGNPTGKEQVYAYTSFIYTKGDDWFLVTAGHILDQLAAYKKYPKGMMRIYLSCLGPPASEQKLPVHFADFDDAMKASIDDEDAGLDYGWVYLRPYYRQFLEQDGILPLGERSWLPLDARTFLGQFLTGYPKALLGETKEIGERLSITVEPVTLSVNQIVPDPPDLKKTAFRRYIGRITPRADISIDGTSGGPVFAIGKDDEGAARYWLIALQSRQSLDHTLAFGCPAEVFIPRMLKEIEDQRRERGRKGDATR
jgi:hypothetical protein